MRVRPRSIELNRQSLQALFADLIGVWAAGRMEHRARTRHHGLAAVEFLAIAAERVKPDIGPVVPVLADPLRPGMDDAEHAHPGMPLDFDLQPMECRAGRHLRIVQYKSPATG